MKRAAILPHRGHRRRGRAGRRGVRGDVRGSVGHLRPAPASSRGSAARRPRRRRRSPPPRARSRPPSSRRRASRRRPPRRRRRSSCRHPLTGRLVTPAVAARHPIAVMIDDLSPARPQSGFSAASIVWQAPAEGGIPRYMMVFQENIPGDVGPVRQLALLLHRVGRRAARGLRPRRRLAAGSRHAPRRRATASSSTTPTSSAGAAPSGGSRPASPPHNLYTTGKQLRRLVAQVGAKDGPIKWPWTFAPDAPLEQRPVGGRITVNYLANAIRYDYDRTTNTYLRSNTSEKKQIDASTKQRVAPKNVIVMLMHFGPLNDGSKKHRLEATRSSAPGRPGSRRTAGRSQAPGRRRA